MIEPSGAGRIKEFNTFFFDAANLIMRLREQHCSGFVPCSPVYGGPGPTCDTAFDIRLHKAVHPKVAGDSKSRSRGCAGSWADHEPGPK